MSVEKKKVRKELRRKKMEKERNIKEK